MTNWRRNYKPGGTFFFTLVTEKRKRWLTTPTARNLLRQTIKQCRHRWPFEIQAIVLLPDHLHTIWTLPANDNEYSKRWGWIKKEFTKTWLASGALEQTVNDSRRKDRRHGIWQRSFWEHTIRDENDFIRHMDYIHYNPVKHQLAERPRDWQWSSFHRLVREHVYPIDWFCPETITKPITFDDISCSVGE